jgi:phosphoserine phosphatase
MVELLRYLEANGFTTFIASGGDRDFMRAVAEQLYAVPRERVIGSSMGWSEEGGLIYKSSIEFFDDGPEKPVRIWSRTGRRPLLAAGNSNGDIEMLRYTPRSGQAHLAPPHPTRRA